ncbi:3-deoxy-manno-octulosonate-8-phosphatase KdsC [Legionella worsleiensis]|uniref:3-deoxy-D-manno-octulosonate 8-phosphate phosphatase KdsC n=1 Tax=Legionella worsleiensis TaxID=45076 RepID=A0A0W1A3K2_9GAMM|nr:3-deoxy-manno-octulosonate-8-phosphatase KdsC [Legionella worsleiensis]KTD75964.1 hydrolase [Legionella worsleiensis]STY32977.1 hydrolase [Legionella worsleiensis]
MNELFEKAKKVKCLICDVDGVLSDGLLHIDNHGNELKSFHVQDGMGLKLLMAAGIDVAVITTARNAVVDHRMKQLGVVHYFKGQVDKRNAYQQLKETLGLQDEQFAYIGDDLPDLPLIQQVGLGVAVGNAVTQVKEFADWQTQQTGGRGAVRELCDFILNAQDKMDLALEGYLRQ